jgi:hypothetical protein
MTSYRVLLALALIELWATLLLIVPRISERDRQLRILALAAGLAAALIAIAVLVEQF